MKYSIIFTIILSLAFQQSMASLKPRWIPEKPMHTTVNSDYFYPECVTVKFIDESRVRLRSDMLVSLNNYNLTPFNSVIQRYKFISISPLFSRPEEVLDAERESGQRRSGDELADLNCFYRFILERPEDSEKFIDEMNGLDIVELAYPEPRIYQPLEDIPPETPDFTDLQGYLDEAPGGIDARVAWELPGGKGEGIRVVAMEVGMYQVDHEDLKEPFYVLPRNNGHINFHATSTVGILTGIHNEYGISGICPEVEIGCYDVSRREEGWPNIANHINQVADTLGEGSIFYFVFNISTDIEQNVNVEYILANYEAINNATRNGMICLESAGNTGVNYDTVRIFDPDVRHSGAIFVGAGAPPIGNHGPDRSRLEFSCYGRRVELQGWGREVATTGLGELFNPRNDARQRYRSNFSGTSSATPIVAGAVACIQGIVKVRTGGQILFDWEQMRDLLVETGTPQNEEGDQGHIGPLPDLAEAIENIPFPYGVLYGNVTDAETDDPVEGATVAFLCDTTTTDADGNWWIDEAIALDQFSITVSFDGFIDSVRTDLEFEADDTLEINVSLRHSEFELSVNDFHAQLEVEQEIELPFTMRNNGNGLLRWSVERLLLGEANRDFWELRHSIPAGREVEDNRLQGVVYLEDHYYVTGDGNDTNWVYVFDREGAEVNRFQQDGDSNYVLKDLAYDGNLIWGVGDDIVCGFTPDGDFRNSFESPFRSAAVTWDSDRERLWISGTTSDYIAQYDRNGNETGQLSRYGFYIYGLAHWSEDPDGYPLYVFHKIGNDGQYVHKINPETEDTLFVTQLEPEEGGRPGGAFITDQMDIYSWTFVALSNHGRDDRIDVWQLHKNLAWFSVDSSEGIVEPNEEQELTVTLSSDQLEIARYEGELLFTHNTLIGETIIPVVLDVALDVDDNSDHNVPNDFGITSVYPNPFNSTVNIRFNISISQRTTLKVYDISGREIAMLFDKTYSAGHYQVRWNASTIPSGMYFLQMRSVRRIKFRKLIIIK